MIFIVVFGIIVAFAIFVIFIFRSGGDEKYDPEKDENKGLLTALLKKHLLEIENSDKYFSNIYDHTLFSKDLKKGFLNSYDISGAKKRFSDIAERLLEESKTNVCFMDAEKCKSIQADDEKITQDTIRALPIMADFYNCYNDFYKNLYLNTCLFKVLPCHMLLYGNLVLKAQGNESVTDEDLQKSKDLIKDFFDYEVKAVVRGLFSEESDEEFEKKINIWPLRKFLICANYIAEKEEMYEKYALMWVHKLQEIGDVYSKIISDLGEYFEEIEAKMEKELPWFSITLFSFPGEYLFLREETSEECLRVLELYKKGIMSGKYMYWTDPKYRKN